MHNDNVITDLGHIYIEKCEEFKRSWTAKQPKIYRKQKGGSGKALLPKA